MTMPLPPMEPSPHPHTHFGVMHAKAKPIKPYHGRRPTPPGGHSSSGKGACSMVAVVLPVLIPFAVVRTIWLRKKGRIQ